MFFIVRECITAGRDGAGRKLGVRFIHMDSSAQRCLDERSDLQRHHAVKSSPVMVIDKALAQAMAPIQGAVHGHLHAMLWHGMGMAEYPYNRHRKIERLMDEHSVSFNALVNQIKAFATAPLYYPDEVERAALA